MSTPVASRSRSGVLIIAGLMILIVAIWYGLRIVWTQSEDMLEKARADFSVCMAEAASDEAEAYCARELEEAWRGYWIP